MFFEHKDMLILIGGIDMRSLTINCFTRILVFTCFGLVQKASADDGLTQSNKALVREFYTTVLINWQVDAAPQFLRADYIQHNPNVPTGLKGFMDTFRERLPKSFRETTNASCSTLLAKTTWLSFMCGRRGRVVTGSTN
jgi:hypothetical protein